MAREIGFDESAQKVLKAVTVEMREHLFRDAGNKCRRCKRPIGIYYCEDRVYAVRCVECGTVTLIYASNPKDAAEKVGNSPTDRNAPIVPCLECKHYAPDFFWCDRLDINTDHDFFCAYGAMKGDAHDDNG